MEIELLSKALPSGLRAPGRARSKSSINSKRSYATLQGITGNKSATRRLCSIVALALAVAACRGETGNADSASADMVQLAAGRKSKTIRPAPAPDPAPAPAPAVDTSSSSLEGAAPIASNFDPAIELAATSIPPSAAPDVVGAFRFICLPGQIKSDDPIVYPGQPGRSHLHQFFGNDTADANSTYASLRGAGNSSCMSPVNRSAYWIPAILNGKGSVVRPDYVTIYYKRRPLSDPIVSDPAHPQYQGKGIKLPNGLKFIFGRDMLNLSQPQTGEISFSCDGPTAVPQSSYKNFEEAQAGCAVGNRIGARISAPDCWDGKNLDSPDHRSHVAYGGYGSWGYYKCPTTHPYVIPAFTMGVWFTQAQGEIYSFVSDSMDTSAGHKRGDTFHADFFMAWDPVVHDLWEKNCIDKMLNCSAGDLGNGRQIKQTWPHSWTASPRLVAIPS